MNDENSFLASQTVAAEDDRSRRGAAVVEVALLLPVLVILVFGAIELTNGIFLKQSLAIGAYEGIRVASRPGGTGAQALAKIDEVMLARNVSGYQVTFTPEVTSETPRGTELSILVRVPSGTLSWGPLHLFANRDIEHVVRMVRL